MSNPSQKKIISLLSNEGKQMLEFASKSEHSFIDDRILSVFRKQVGSSTCGLVSSCIVMAAFSLNMCKDINNDSFRPRNKYQAGSSESDGNVENSLCWYPEETILHSEHTNFKDILVNGLTLEQVALLLNSYNFNVSLKFASETDVETFRADIVKAFTPPHAACIIVNYDAKLIDDSLSFHGHHSPLGGYNSQTGDLLVMDVWPLSDEGWVKVELLLLAMNTTDKDSGKGRGYLIISGKA